VRSDRDAVLRRPLRAVPDDSPQLLCGRVRRVPRESRLRSRRSLRAGRRRVLRVRDVHPDADRADTGLHSNTASNVCAVVCSPALCGRLQRRPARRRG
jgi:hypothetical protein